MARTSLRYWSYEISRIASLLNLRLPTLTRKHADTRLTAESTLQDAVEIAAQTADLKVKSTRRYAMGQLDAAADRPAGSFHPLVGYIVPEEAKARRPPQDVATIPSADQVGGFRS